MSSLRVDGMPTEDKKYQHIEDLLEATEIKNCDFAFFYDQPTPNRINTINSLIKSWER